MYENSHAFLVLSISGAWERRAAMGAVAMGRVWFAVGCISALRFVSPNDECVGGPGQEWFPLQCVDCVVGSGLN